MLILNVFERHNGKTHPERMIEYVSRKFGVLVISHGSRESGWAALVDQTAEDIRSRLPADVPVEAAFLEHVEGRLIQDGINRLEESGVTDLLAIPLFVSSGSTHVREIGWALGVYPSPEAETELTPFRYTARLEYGKPVDDDPELVDIILDRLSGLSIFPGRAHESVLLIGHGSDKPGFHETWRKSLSSLARKVREAGGYADSEFALLMPDSTQDAIRSLKTRRPDAAVLAVPVFLSEGYYTKVVIPQRLAGFDCRYDGSALMPHPRAADWAARQAWEWLRNGAL